MHAPEKIEPTSLRDYVEVMTRVVFEPGLSWAVLEAKWPGFAEAFDGFDPLAIAGLTPGDVEDLMQDTRIVRNRKKIESTIHNAGEMLALEKEFGDFRTYLRSHDSYEATVRDLRSRLKFVGEMGAYHFLYVVGEKVPDHEEWMKQHPPRAR
jgi:DNA-3-methyladenine glycosylase I